MPVIIIIGIIVLLSYAVSPPSSPGSRYVSGREQSWEGCGVPSNPTYQDWLDCQEWRKEKHARADAEERAP